MWGFFEASQDLLMDSYGIIPSYRSTSPFPQKSLAVITTCRVHKGVRIDGLCLEIITLNNGKKPQLRGDFFPFQFRALQSKERLGWALRWYLRQSKDRLGSANNTCIRIDVTVTPKCKALRHVAITCPGRLLFTCTNHQSLLKLRGVFFMMLLKAHGKQRDCV